MRGIKEEFNLSVMCRERIFLGERSVVLVIKIIRRSRFKNCDGKILIFMNNY